MSHYFKNDETLLHNVTQYDVHISSTSFRFLTDRGVFSKSGLDFGTRVLLENIEVDASVKTVIDMGCGYGPIGIYLAKTHPDLKIHMVDINTRALDLAHQNIKLNQVENVTVHESFLFEDISFKADLILTNPPIRAGKKIIFDLYEQAHQHLNESGILCVVIQKKQGAPSTYDKLTQIFSTVEVSTKSKGYWVIIAKR